MTAMLVHSAAVHRPGTAPNAWQLTFSVDGPVSSTRVVVRGLTSPCSRRRYRFQKEGHCIVKLATNMLMGRAVRPNRKRRR